MSLVATASTSGLESVGGFQFGAILGGPFLVLLGSQPWFSWVKGAFGAVVLDMAVAVLSIVWGWRPTMLLRQSGVGSIH